MFTEQISIDVWNDKYKYGDERTIEDMIDRVVDAIYVNDEEDAKERMRDIMKAGLWIPAGRILAGAGTSKVVTLMNCYVNEVVEDSMEGILSAFSNTTLTLQQGGGIGTDFSTLRPRHAVLRRTGEGSEASGPIPFMEMWDSGSRTVKSAGARRGAMMATLRCDHPDLPEFIEAKHKKGMLEQFNVSVLVTDEFMYAITIDDDWYLHFPNPPVTDRPKELQNLDFEDGDGTKQYVYSVWKARDLWNMILESTYEYSEPGVIFIDRVNDRNNLQYCEEISCTNPCGEQPLPPNGACNLGSINLALLVEDPFEDYAAIDLYKLELVAREGVRFLDNVIDISRYPLLAQAHEQVNKRRLGLGVTGLADMLAQLKVPYGSRQSAEIVEQVMRTIAIASYNASVTLAESRGCFPFYTKQYLDSPFIQQLPQTLRERIDHTGIRNSLLLTIAPTGTISVVFDNVSSGLEPTFAHSFNRNYYGTDNEWHKYTVNSYAYRKYQEKFGSTPVEELPEYMRTAEVLTVKDHLRIQSACQRWIDASVSKTINLPKETTFEEFVEVYEAAYQLGCKGCTTYRPSIIRGSILSTTTSTEEPDISNVTVLPARPEILTGVTYKISWPSWNSAIYMTINSDDSGKPFEIFIQSKDARHQEWITALTIMISAVMRRGDNYKFIAEELSQVCSMHDTAFIGGKFYGSLVSRIAEVIDEHFIKQGIYEGVPLITSAPSAAQTAANTGNIPKGETCPSCSAPTFWAREGCYSCDSCGYSRC